jgi:hypothetical protein
MELSQDLKDLKSAATLHAESGTKVIGVSPQRVLALINAVEDAPEDVVVNMTSEDNTVKQLQALLVDYEGELTKLRAVARAALIAVEKRDSESLEELKVAHTRLAEHYAVSSQE